MFPEDIETVTLALQSGMLTNGTMLADFETDFGRITEAPYAVGVSSGTAALHMAVHALGVKPEQKVIVPTLTFAATANAVLYSGGSVEFVDVNPETLLIDSEYVADKLQANPDQYAGVIAVDFAGYPVNTIELADVCHEHDTWLIEDAAHALGAVANYDNKVVPVGSSQYADATVFSFHPAKHITTGEGGMITVRQAETIRILRLLRSHAMDNTGAASTDEPWRYKIEQLGFNYRLSEVNAALGRSQLARVPGNIALRQSIASAYQEAFDGTNIRTPNYDNEHTNAYHLFVARVDNRKTVYAQLREAGIFTQIHYVPLHMQPFYREIAKDAVFPHAEQYYLECLSLPMYPSLSENEQQYVIDKVKTLNSAV
jgi:dTDP-4-amino-4,6-dideoxygalactose transaminase